MGHKVPPKALRLGINQQWSSRWFFSKNLPVFLEADYLIREAIKKMFPKAGITDIIIERKSPDHCKVIINTGKAGLVVGRDGQLLKNLIKVLDKKLKNLFSQKNLQTPSLDIDVVEVKKPFSSAAYLAEMIASDIEKGLPVRKVIKKVIEKVSQNKEILGIKVRAAGRLNGSTIKRRETISWGKIPLSTLVADIDSVSRPVLTKYGIIGIKVWLYKGEKSKIAEENDALA